MMMVRIMPRRKDSEHEQDDPGVPFGNSSIHYPNETYCGEEITLLETGEAIRNVVRRAQHEMGKVLYDEMLLDFEDLITSAAEEPHPTEEEVLWIEAYNVWKEEGKKKKERKLIDFWLLPAEKGHDLFYSLYYMPFYEDDYKDDVECFKQWSIIENLISLPSGAGFDSAIKMFKTNVQRYVKECSSSCASHMPKMTRTAVLKVHQEYFSSLDVKSSEEEEEKMDI
mmetsp:Transcript_27939/g.41255  ORF Transcript_27939/g.41255 Transcript_27939/m.41255 type:complete len:225 (-) Transcript_27939:361-1035(-)